jgi:hypothetical protein
MRVYCCSGSAFDDAGSEGTMYYRTKAEALKAAREATSKDDRLPEGSTATVQVNFIDAPITHDMVVALLNHAGWCRSALTIATVSNGKVHDELVNDDDWRNEVKWQARMAGDLEA